MKFIKQHSTFFPFVASSLLAALIDFSVFFVVYHLSHIIVAAFLAGRLISGVINYSINHQFAFESDRSHKSAAMRYAALATFLYFAVYFTIVLIHHYSSNIYLAKCIAEPLWFIVSYTAQHYWLFREPLAKPLKK